MTPAEQRVRDEIAGSGPMAFARFMNLALYAPDCGYYENTERAPGRSGDFFTSVGVGPVFGFLLAEHFAERCGSWPGLDLVEAGAHDGQLADDVLTAIGRFHPSMLGGVRYWVLEPSGNREEWQRRRLSHWAPRMGWIRKWEELPRRVRGFIFCNELLDAFPVHRFEWNAPTREWLESGVTVRDGRLGWCRLPKRTDPGPTGPCAEAGLAEVAALEPHLSDGFVLESAPGAATWWRDAARALEAGWLLTFDYGFGESAVLRPEHPKGTLRAYHRHRVCEDLLARPGEQDLTAHVDFRRLIAAGEEVGLMTEAFLPQGRWLAAIAAKTVERGGNRLNGWRRDGGGTRRSATRSTWGRRFGC